MSKTKFEGFLKGKSESRASKVKTKFYRKKWFFFVIIPICLFLIVGGFLAFKTGFVLSKISTSDESGLRSFFNMLPVIGKNEDIKGEADGRINILLLGYRGKNMPGGDLLTDTIMLLSYKPQENKVAIISIPRDLFVKIPQRPNGVKINAVYSIGEGEGNGKGLEEAKKIVGEVSGLSVHYAVTMNFEGFRNLIDTLGGVEVFLDSPFYETSQFVQGQECGVEFTLPAGVNKLDGETALCYARARENTSDFDRARRQQVIIKALKDKLISAGTLTDFGKINGILNVVGDNVKTDFASHEMRKFYEKYSQIKDAQIFQRVFENSEEGKLKVPDDRPEWAGYILIPRAGWDNYSDIHQVCQNIFEIESQSNINPVKQYVRPSSKQTNEEDEIEKKAKKKKE